MSDIGLERIYFTNTNYCCLVPPTHTYIRNVLLQQNAYNPLTCCIPMSEHFSLPLLPSRRVGASSSQVKYN